MEKKGAAAARAAIHRAKLRSESKCARCLKKTKKLPLCRACGLKRRQYQRDKIGSAPWRKGGRGRPPVFK